MKARREQPQRVPLTPLQVAWRAQAEVFFAVRERLTPREQEEFFALAATRLARETARDADWTAWEEERS